MVARRKVFAALVAVGATAMLVVVTGFTSKRDAFSGTVYIGMDSPLTGPTSSSGRATARPSRPSSATGTHGAGSRAGVSSSTSSTTRRTRRRPCRTSRSSSPTRSTSGFSARAPRPQQSRQGRSRAGRGCLHRAVTADDPRWSAASRTSTWRFRRRGSSPTTWPPIFASVQVTKVWLMGDNGGFGRDGPAQVATLAASYGIQVVDTTIFAPTTSDFSASWRR